MIPEDVISIFPLQYFVLFVFTLSIVIPFDAKAVLTTSVTVGAVFVAVN